jgi:hypothetical protein
VHLGDPVSVIERDHYGRFLRYVVANHVDVDLSQINHGARARYDSTDGYQWHPRQAAYHAADARHPNYRGGWSTARRDPVWTYPYGSRADEHPCPRGYPVKANDNSGIYHVPGQTYYDITNNRHCYASTAQASAAAYRAAKI